MTNRLCGSYRVFTATRRRRASSKPRSEGSSTCPHVPTFSSSIALPGSSTMKHVLTRGRQYQETVNNNYNSLLNSFHPGVPAILVEIDESVQPTYQKRFVVSMAGCTATVKTGLSLADRRRDVIVFQSAMRALRVTRDAVLPLAACRHEIASSTANAVLANRHACEP